MAKLKNHILEDELAEIMAKEIQEEIDREIIDSMVWEATLQEHKDWHLVQIQWTKKFDEPAAWNEACAWAVEQFGLPGDKYMTHATQDAMDFLFKNQEDAIMMTLKWVS
jgi:hypothetical protein